MQATGTYISRSLSYTGAEFSIIRVDVDPVFKVSPALCEPLCQSSYAQRQHCTVSAWLASQPCTSRGIDPPEGRRFYLAIR